MSVIVEGPDLVGKSTLCRRTGLRYYRTTARSRCNAYKFALMQAGRTGVAWDRWWMTEVIYSRVLGRTCHVEPHEAWACCLEALNHGQRLIVLDETNTELERRWAREPQTNLTHDQWREVVTAYRWFPFAQWLPVHRSWRDEFKTPEHHPYAHSWGSHTPQVLLVAERPNPRVVHTLASVSRPLCPKSKAHGGAYLFRALEHVGLRPFDIHIANAFLPDGSEVVLQDLYCLLGCPKVVALGKVADKQLTRRGVPHGTVEHPQYRRRFLAGLEEQYGVEVKRAAFQS